MQKEIKQTTIRAIIERAKQSYENRTQSLGERILQVENHKNELAGYIADPDQETRIMAEGGIATIEEYLAMLRHALVRRNNMLFGTPYPYDTSNDWKRRIPYTLNHE